MGERKIDPYRKWRAYRRTLRKIRSASELIPENKVYVMKYLKDSELGKTILKGRNRRIGVARNLRAAQYLMQLDRWFRKPFTDVTVPDMERLIDDLQKGRIGHAKTGERYSGETLSSLKSFIRKFWKWLKGDCKVYPKEVEWIDSNEAKAQIPALPGLRDAVMKVCATIDDPLERAVLMVLFDSGTRPDEFLNVRIKDVSFGEDGTAFIQIRYSKTFQRPISLPISTEYLRAWLEVHPYRHRPEAQLFPIRTGAALSQRLRRLCEPVLGVHVFPYMFRHASATYYCRLLDRATFCKRFGWKYTSDMPDRYIDMSQIQETNTIEAVRRADRLGRESGRALERDESPETKAVLQQLGESLALLHAKLADVEKLHQ